MSKIPINKGEQKKIARERIIILFQEAEKRFLTNPELSHRYVALARKIAMKVKTRIPPEFKRNYCKHCYKYLKPGINARIRTRDSKVIISCLECKKFTRIPLHIKRKPKTQLSKKG